MPPSAREPEPRPFEKADDDRVRAIRELLTSFGEDWRPVVSDRDANERFFAFVFDRMRKQVYEPDQVSLPLDARADAVLQASRKLPEPLAGLVRFSLIPLFTIPDSISGALRSGHLRRESFMLLVCTQLCRFARRSEEEWAETGRQIRETGQILATAYGIEPQNPWWEVNRRSITLLIVQLDWFERIAREADALVREAGGTWDWSTGNLKRVPGPEGRLARSLLRDFVEALVAYQESVDGRWRSKETWREWITGEMTAANLLIRDSSKDSRLYSAIKSVLSSRRRKPSSDGERGKSSAD